MAPPASTTPDSAVLRLPAARRVILCVGPGGVGKTTVAAAIGLQAAERGRKVLVLTIDPSRRLAQALGVDPARGHAPGSITTVPGSAERGHPLDCLLLDTQQVFDAIVRGYSRSAEAAARMLENPIYRATVQHLGGALEYAAIARVHMLHSESDYDLIILDTPPTANAIEFLEAPGRIMELLDNPAAKFLASSSKIGMKFLGLASSVMMRAFEALGGGPFMRQLGDFLQDFSDVLGEFQRRAGDVANLLVSPDTGVVITTSATDFSVREAKDFMTVLSSRGLRIDGVVLNRADPPLPPRPPDELVLQALRAQLGGEAEDALPAVVSAYAGARVQSERSRVVHRSLKEEYASTPITVLERMDPPPTTLDELRSMGRAIMG